MCPGRRSATFSGTGSTPSRGVKKVSTSVSPIRHAGWDHTPAIGHVREVVVQERVAVLRRGDEEEGEGPRH
jgi:hypothetical protein